MKFETNERPMNSLFGQHKQWKREGDTDIQLAQIWALGKIVWHVISEDQKSNDEI